MSEGNGEARQPIIDQMEKEEPITEQEVKNEPIVVQQEQMLHPSEPAVAQISCSNEFVGGNPMPPSYLEVRNLPQQIGYNGHPLPERPLTYVDIVPLGEHERYNDLILRANSWLASNESFRLQSCETVVIPYKNRQIDTHLTLYHDPACGLKRFVRILRLWVVKRVDFSEKVQVLRTVVRVPRRRQTSILVPGSVTDRVSGAFLVAGMATGGTSAFAPFSECIASLNNELQRAPLPGTILRIESQKIKVTEMHQQVDFDHDKLYWDESGQAMVHIHVLRVFYVEGESAKEIIGCRDVSPAYISCKGNGVPLFEPFTQTLYKAGQWIHSQQNLRLTNIQTLETRVSVDYMTPPSQRQAVFDPDRVDFPANTIMDPMFVKYLRVYFVQSPSYQASRPCCLTHRPFLPYQIGDRLFENSSNNMDRLNSWIGYNAGVSGVTERSIVCVETINCRYKPESTTPVDTEVTSCSAIRNASRYFLYGVRLYVDGVFTEPPPHVIPPPFPVSQPNSCNLV